MKIYGDEAATQFRTHAQEPGVFCGYDDVLVGNRETSRRITFSFFGNSDELVTTQPKLYLHIFNTFWSSVTGLFREYCMPWRWKAAYLDQENGTPLQRILVCTSVYDGSLSDRLNAVLGQSLFVTNLISAGQYEEVFGQEYLKIPRQDGQHVNRIIHPLGEWAGLSASFSSDDFCHIYRIRDVFSLFKYHFLKAFSSEWEEVAVQAGQVLENVLIKRSDRATISRIGLIIQN